MNEQRGEKPAVPARPARTARGTTPTSGSQSSSSVTTTTHPSTIVDSRSPHSQHPVTSAIPPRTGSYTSSSAPPVSQYVSDPIPTFSSNNQYDKDSLNSSGTPKTPRSIPSNKSSSSSSLSVNGDVGIGVKLRDNSSARSEPGYSNFGGEDMAYIVAGEEPRLTVKGVLYDCPYSEMSKTGTLTITNYRLLYRSSNVADYDFEIPMSNILSIEKMAPPQGIRIEGAFRIGIWCKDLRRVVMTFTKSADQPSQKNTIIDTLRQYAFPHSHKGRLFAFDYKGEYNFDGWSVYDAKAEYRRQGVPNDMWRLTIINQKYFLCDTYPSVLAVPNAASDELLTSVAAFRSRGRLPVLSWIHPVSHATITRSSQPLVGINGRRSKDDENYIKMIHEANPVYPKLYIMDARPLVNAQANKAKGGGFETEDNYPNTETLFQDIQNIHVMRESLRKLREMCSPKIDDSVHFYGNLDNTHWLLHIKAILVAAVKVVEKVETYKSSVLVHCSDGWDRTAQMTTLAMLMLDPYYRTIRGFEVLIEKEWVSFGHKFAHRIGHGEEKEQSERSPVFLQFIDCVWQIMQQFKTSFEFNERFLIAVLDNLYGCRYGTFLCNYEKETFDKNLRTKTISLWSYINSNLDDFRSPFYCEIAEDSESSITNVIIPMCTFRYLQLWTRYYARWDPTMKPQEPVEERYKQLLYALDKLTEIRDNLRREALKKRSKQTSNNNSASGSPSRSVGNTVHV